MTEQAVITPAVISMITEGQAELRADFRTMSIQHREDMSRMIEVQSDFGEKFAGYVERDQSRADDIEDLKRDVHSPENGIISRLVKVEKNQAVSLESNSVKWKILAAGTMVGVTLLGGFAGFIYWLVRNVPIINP